jgi:outer membrane protein OmpA-like peptidoglycan-associated protein
MGPIQKECRQPRSAPSPDAGPAVPARQLGRRLCRPLALATALGALLAARPAAAVGDAAPIDLNRFHPAPGTGKILTIDMADVGGHIYLVPQLFLHYADLPLVYTLGGQREADLVRHRLTADLSLSLSLWKRLQIALAFPVTLYQQGEQATLPTNIPGLTAPPQAATAGQEDLRLLVKGVIWRNERWGFGAVGDLAVPTGNANSYLGSRLPTFNLRLLGHVTWGRLSAALNVGWLFASTEELVGVRTGMGLSYGAGAQVEIFRHAGGPFWLLAELYGLAHARFETPKESPAELIAAAKTAYKDWTFFLGLGPGLSRGYGEPNVRVFAGASWSWQRPTPPKPPPVIPPAPVPPPDLKPCEGEDCPDAVKKPVSVVIKGPKLELSERVFFDFDKDTIKSISFELLDEVVKVLKVRTDLGKIRIEGHTDGVGSDEYNLDLSKRRARSVVIYLLEHGIEVGRLSYEGYGKRCPVDTNDTAEGRARNRRVDFVIVDDPNAPPSSPDRCPALRK